MSFAVAACGGDDDAGGDAGDTATTAAAPGTATPDTTGASAPDAGGLPSKSGLVGVADDAGEPVDGGTLNFAVWFQASSLDPADGNISGVANGTALLAVYDVLMRWDAATDTFEPQLAESLEPNADFTQWTLKLRPDVTFSDNTPLNSAAVVYSINRANEKQSPAAAGLIARIESMDTPDDLTVVFNVKDPWARFPFVLTNSLGLVVSPTAAEAEGDDFAANPVGAGPFVLDRFSEGEEMVLKARPDYWAGKPHLDSVRFVPVTSGDQARLDAMNAGQFEMLFLRSPSVLKAALDKDIGGYVEVQNFGELLLMNDRPDRPTADPNVRKAIALAIDTDVLNDRVNGGLGIWSKAMFPSSSQWDTTAGAAATDPEQAKALLQTAKDAGFDGKVALLSDSSADRMAESLTIQAQLQAVGFEVTLDQKASIGDVIGLVQSDHDYDMALYGNNTVDAAPLQELDVFFNGPSGYAEGYGDLPKVQTQLDALALATTPEQEQQIIDELQTIWTDTMPSMPLAAVREFVGWSSKVHGVLPTSATMVILSNAWIEQ